MKSEFNRFNLDQAIAEWRQRMTAGGLKSPVVLDELEGHLREVIEQQARSGVSSQQAFEVAVRQIGRADLLKSEFEKVGGLAETRDRKLRLACLVLGALGYAAPLVLSLPNLSRQMNPTEFRLALAAFVLTILSLFSGLWAHRFLPMIADQRARTRVQFAVGIPGLVWLGIFGFFLLPRLEFSLGGLLVATLWAFTPPAFLGGIIFGLDEAARKRRAAAGS